MVAGKLQKIAALYGLPEEKLTKSTQWKNKKRCLVLSSRGIMTRQRHLMNDMRKMMAHHKPETKWEKNQSLKELSDLCQLNSCRNCLYFEARKNDLFLWLVRTKGNRGPTIKMEVHAIHTMQELKFTGNCLLSSRPILTFDKEFESKNAYKTMKMLLTEVFAVPNHHPESKPFHDHTLSFFIFDKKIFARHYQIQPFTPADGENPEKVNLIEVGPRFVLDPIKILEGAFEGKCLWKNQDYLSPAAVRRARATSLGAKAIQKIVQQGTREHYLEQHSLPEKEFSFRKIFKEAPSDDDNDETSEEE